MTRQFPGPWLDLLPATGADNGAPVGDEATRLILANFQGRPTVLHGLRIDLIGDAGISAEYFLWGRDKEDNVWDPLGENDGQLNAATAIAGTVATGRYFVIQNLGMFKDLYLQVLNSAGAGFSTLSRLHQLFNPGD